MAIELFDEVDKCDKPTGRKLSKQEAHDNKLLHRCVAVFLFDKRGNMYVQPHVKSNNRLDHSVGGHVSSGEDYLTAAKREMSEEINLSGVELQEIATSYYSDEGEYQHMFGIYACIAPDAWVFKPNDEVHGLKLMQFEDIIRQMNAHPSKFVTGFLHTMKKYLEVRNSPFKVSVPHG